MTLIILLSVLIACAIFVTIFISIQANKISKAYLDSVYTSDADFNKPTFIRVNDDEDLDYIFNTNDICLITAFNYTDRENNKYALRICLKDEDKTDITFKYDDKLIRDEIYAALSDYDIYDRIVFNLKSNE